MLDEWIVKNKYKIYETKHRQTQVNKYTLHIVII